LGSLLSGFEPVTVEIAAGVRIHARVGGSGPALLLLHGHPQTHAIWHRIAPSLASHYRLVMADLRGYGDSSRPTAEADHFAYSKRTMAADMVTLMRYLGHEHFAVLAHDRGARVAHRLALDYPSCVSRMVLLDIAPTLAMYQQTSEAFARAYWHWFFLIQPAPLPERLIEADPGAYVLDMMGSRYGGLSHFDPRALEEYVRCASLPGSAHAMCEDYRAAASIDLQHDQESLARNQRLTMPIQVLWGARGVVARCFDPLAEWRAVSSSSVEGEALPCGHYMAEEAPDALLAKVEPFLSSQTGCESTQR
jgi:haloacetate dehalogenase